VEFLRRGVAEPNPATRSQTISSFFALVRGAVRAEFEHQAALDWKTFLSLRATELRPHGRLVVALPSLADDGTTAFATIMNHANVVLSELTITGVITAEERRRITGSSRA